MACSQRTMGARKENLTLFKPKLELKETPEDHILQFHVPGFSRDEIKIRYVSSTKVLSISGEKYGRDNKWSRFSEAISVPENFEVNRLRAQFDKGSLTITMPKKFITPIVPKEELRRNEEGISQDSLLGAYEEFQPKVEKRENMDAYLLKVYLPRFSRDQVKIRYISSSRKISISGERPLEVGKRWSRFDQIFPVPENFNEERLGAKFDEGILTITMPKKFSSLFAPREEVKTSHETGPMPLKDVMAEKKPQKAEEVILPKPMEGLKKFSSLFDPREEVKTSHETGPMPLKDAMAEQKPQKAEEVIPPKPMEGLKRSSSLLSLEEIDQKSSIGDAYEKFQPKSKITEKQEAYQLQIHLPGFTKDQVKIKYISSSRVMSIIGEGSIEGGNRWIHVDEAYPVPEDCDAERIQSKFDKGILSITMPKKFIPQLLAPREEARITQEKVPSSLDKYTSPSFEEARDKRSIASLPSFPQKGREELVAKPTRLTWLDEHAATRTANGEGKRIEDIVDIIGKGIQEVTAYTCSAVTTIGDGTLNDEEKHLLAVLIAALGAYVSYRSTASGKPYNY